ncbi:MAG: hypothetical protein KF774_16165 [Planctomyces sp.]|nr:hypothetical protein [Planctomyces sp.]
MPISAVLIWNPAARAARSSPELRSQLDAHPELEVLETTDRDAARRAVHDAVAGGAERIIAAGGDGSVSAVVAALAEADSEARARVELAVLPLGTGNDLARSLDMPLEPEAALEVCLRGAAAPMDVLELKRAGGRRIVANMLTAGNTGKYTDIVTDDMKARWGPLCYMRGAVDLLQELDVFEIDLSIDGGPPERIAALNLFFANGRTSGGGLEVSPEARLDDGRLDLLAIREGTALDLATLTLDYVFTDFRANELVVCRQCRRIDVRAFPEIPMTADGDALEPGDFSVSVLPAALRVVRGVPPIPPQGAAAG